jgi:hypothetical protein
MMGAWTEGRQSVEEARDTWAEVMAVTTGSEVARDVLSMLRHPGNKRRMVQSGFRMALGDKRRLEGKLCSVETFVRMRWQLSGEAERTMAGDGASVLRSMTTKSRGAAMGDGGSKHLLRRLDGHRIRATASTHVGSGDSPATTDGIGVALGSSDWVELCGHACSRGDRGRVHERAWAADNWAGPGLKYSNRIFHCLQMLKLQKYKTLSSRCPKIFELDMVEDKLKRNNFTFGKK